jgi:hypothetical protein
MSERVLEQCRLFNEGVRTGDWGGYLGRFADYVGRDAIAAVYAQAPPEDTLNVTSVESAGDEDLATVAWSTGGGGTLRVRWSAGRIAELTASFDEPA